MADNTDCDDSRDEVYPGAPERCDPSNRDEDCDGLADDADPDVLSPDRLWFPDADEDGHGEAGASPRAACDDPSRAGDRWSADDSDCNDRDAEVHPGAPEVCDGRDNDCDGGLDRCLTVRPPLVASGRWSGGRLPRSRGQRECGAEVRGERRRLARSSLWCLRSGRRRNAYLIPGPATGTGSPSGAHAILRGEQAGDHAGYSLRGGDTDGDGRADLLVGAWKSGVAEVDAGAVYLVLGPITGEMSLGLAEGRAWGQAASDRAGETLAFSDLDGDGLDDIIVGSVYNDGFSNNAGAVYILNGPLTSARSLAEPDARRVGEAANDYSASSIDAAGDINGDGIGDLLVGAAHGDGGAIDSGVAYALHGPITGVAGLGSADGRLLGVDPFDYAGVAVPGPGDVNGDGYADLLVGAPGADAGLRNEGAVYLVLGPATGDHSLTTAHATLRGEAPLDQLGQHLGAAGDIDGDGFADLLLASSRQGAGGDQAGAIWRLAGPLTGSIDLAAQPGKWRGDSPEDRAGVALHGAGDLDGDGLLDLVVGATGVDLPDVEAGAAYLLPGASF